MAFSYQPLSVPDDIRLMTLTKAASSHELCGKLEHTNLAQQSSYDALSYVWGAEQDIKCNLVLNNTTLTITPQLHTALRTLISQHGELRLWVDQICINQQDAEEKERQVRLMSKIFRNAEKVIGWVGPANDDSALAIRFFRGLSTLPKGSTEDPRFLTDLLIDPEQGGLVQLPVALFALIGRSMHPAHLFLGRPWFQRLWIVQEVCLARNLELHCGNDTISDSQLFSAVTVLCSIRCDPPVDMLFRGCRRIERLSKLRQLVRNHQRPALSQLAYEFCDWECKDERDRLNALVGIARREGLEKLDVSYKLTAAEHFINFSIDILSHAAGIEILHSAGRGHQDVQSNCTRNAITRVDLPSWVPDWRLSVRPLPLRQFGKTDDRYGYSATDSRPDYHVNKSAKILELRAVYVDSVAVCGLPFYRPLEPADIYHLFISWYGLVCTHLHNCDETMFAHTLTMDAMIKSDELSNLGLEGSKIVNCFAHWQDKNMSEKPSSDPWQNGGAESNLFGEYAARVCRNRRFFITRSGRYGLGPVGIQPGTSIYLIHGLSTPFAVDEQATEHLLCGDCYVNGYMTGKKEVSADDITLRLR